jgi:hypothetical protein
MSNKIRFLSAGILIASGAALLLPALEEVGPTFRADVIFQGSNLSGWHTLGNADWKAQNGEIIGTPKDAGGGWLALDKSFQDVGFYSNVMCTGGCRTGLLLRAEKTPEGMKGVFVSLTEGDLNSYAVRLDAEGKEAGRDKLPPGGRGQGGRGGTPPPAAAGVGVPGGAPGPGRVGGRGANLYPVLDMPAGLNLPRLLRPTGSYHPGQWNEIEVLLFGNTVKPSYNGGALGAGGAPTGLVDQDAYKYGPIALYVGGSGEVRFKNVRYKDLQKLDIPKEHVSANFTMQRLGQFYDGWSAAVADVNRDGHPDVISGPYVYYGPDFTTAAEIYTPNSYNPTSEYPVVSMVNLAYDFTGDGWPDVLIMSGNAGNGTGTLYVNPRGETRHWDKFVVLQPVGNEETLMKDIDGDGKPEIIHAGNNTLRYSKPDPANPTGTWITHTISEPGPWGANIGHGLGVGDINGDGRMDYVNCYGWWEQPPKGSSQELWTHHPQEFGRWGKSQGGAGGAEIGVYDVNGDGLNDVVVSLEGHGFGLAWYEQKREGGKITFVEHIIMDNFLTKNAGDVIFTEPHATAFADFDGNGILDMVTGKRSMSHFGYTDPDPFGPAVLYVYKAFRNKNAPGGAEFVPELIHNRSGVGSHIAIADLNGDGKPDVVTAAIYGTYIFFNQTKPGR